jgi:hypothetical protein
LTPPPSVGINANTKAVLLLKERHVLAGDRFVEAVYAFTDVDVLVADFWNDVEKWRPK